MFDLMPWRNRENKEVVRFRSELDSLCDRFFGPDHLATGEFFRDGSWFPTVDMSEGKKEITVKVEIPGAEPKDFDILLDGKRLTIKGEKKQKKMKKKRTIIEWNVPTGTLTAPLSCLWKWSLTKWTRPIKRAF